MRRPRGVIESSPGDGWVRLAPGEFFSVHNDAPISPNLEELLQWMKQIRGGVLSTSFGIENELVLLALADEFGSNDHGTVGSDYFLREQEWREDNSLQRKIDRAKPIIRAKRSAELADLIIQRLAEYRELRNLLAHYPCWLQPINDRERQLTVALKLFIGDRTHVWEVDTLQATEWDQLLRFVRISIENLRREIVGAPPLNEDGSIPETPNSSQDGTRNIAVGNVAQRVL